MAGDVYRPAAVAQLQTLGRQLELPVHTAEGDGASPVEIATAAMERAKKSAYGAVILDTAGRLHIDETMMDELVQIKRRVAPAEMLLVVDAMTGQDAVQVAEEFHEKVGLTA